MTNRQWITAFLLTLGVAAVVWAVPGVPNIWDNTFETAPAASDPVGEGDDHLRVLKEEIRQRLEAEHHFGSAADTHDNGLHRLGSGRCYIGSAAPTLLDNSASVTDYDNSGLSGGTGTLSDAGTGDGTGEKLGDGRCWYDTDDRVFRLYNGTSGWVTVASISNDNLLTNSQFSGQDSSSTSAPGEGWTALSGTTPTIAYAAKTTGEGVGLLVRTTATGAVDEGIQFTVIGLKASKTYWFNARVLAAVNDSCTARMNTSGGTDVAVTYTGTGAIGVIGGLVTLDATPAGETLELEADADGDICDWYSVGLYEVVPPHYVPQPRVAQVQMDSDGTGAGVADGTAVANVEVAMVVPGPNYYIRVSGHTTLSCDNSDEHITYAVYQSIDGAAGAACANGYHRDTSGSGTFTHSLDCLVSNPVGGSEYAYTWVIVDETGTCHVNEQPSGTNRGETRLILEMIPR